MYFFPKDNTEPQSRHRVLQMKDAVLCEPLCTEISARLKMFRVELRYSSS